MEGIEVNRIKLLIEKFEETFLILSMLLIVFFIANQVFFRYFLGGGLSWGEELARYIHIWQVWIGSSLVIKRDEHIKITFGVNLLPVRFRKYINILASLCFFVLVAFISYKGTLFIIQISETGQTSPSLGIMMSIPYMAIPLGGVLMAIRLIQRIVKILKEDPDNRKEAIE